MNNFLVLGVEGCGKSLFLKTLLRYTSQDGEEINHEENIAYLPSTIPTVGSNLVTITLDKIIECNFREVGGAMAPIWKNYYIDSDAIIYIIDLSNPMQVSSSCILLYELLSNEVIANKEFLLLFNKIDIVNGTTTPAAHSAVPQPKPPTLLNKQEMLKLFRIPQFMDIYKERLTLLDISCYDRTGFDEIIKWINKVAEI